MDILESIVKWIEVRRPFVIVRAYQAIPENFSMGTLILVSHEEIIAEEIVGKSLLVQKAKEVLRQGKTISQTIELEQYKVDVCFEYVSCQSKLLIVGAGHIAVPLSRIASTVGYEVCVLDDRKDYATQERFPDAKDVIVAPFVEGLHSYPLDRETGVTLLTRGHTYDRDCLKVLLEKEVGYIGMICSRRRKDAIFKLLLKDGYQQDQLDKVFAPIGLPTGGETPEEIALSIMAEIVAVRNHGENWVRNLRGC